MVCTPLGEITQVLVDDITGDSKKEFLSVTPRERFTFLTRSNITARGVVRTPEVPVQKERHNY